jgi:hypothetical protein
VTPPQTEKTLFFHSIPYQIAFVNGFLKNNIKSWWACKKPLLPIDDFFAGLTK